MYPVPRLLFQAWRHRATPPLDLFDTHESEHICWPWDLDIFGELNNGRALTIYDLGRIPWSARIGLTTTLRRQRWQVAVAGASVRYRRRVRAFDRIRMLTRGLGWDARFFYVEQSMRLPSGEVASHVLIRSAVTDRSGIVAPARVLAAMGLDLPSPDLPQWARAWTEAESFRPWPPMEDA
jgi:acyl-CoA thioesterase FadM